jgi:hypothetical protein
METAASVKNLSEIAIRKYVFDAISGNASLPA